MITIVIIIHWHHKSTHFKLDNIIHITKTTLHVLAIMLPYHC